MTNKEIIYAYLAGFIDADGSITIVTANSIRKTKTGDVKQCQFRVKLSAHNCKIDPINLLKQEFGGGKLRFKKTGKAKEHANWRPCYEWIITNNQAAHALKCMLPYLTIKKEQANLCLELDSLKKKYSASTRRWNKELNSDLNKKFQELKNKINILNKRGQ